MLDDKHGGCLLYTIDDLKRALAEVKPGFAARVPYEIFEQIFPPGVEDDGSKKAAYDLARAHGLKIDNRPEGAVVYFYKDHDAHRT